MTTKANLARAARTMRAAQLRRDLYIRQLHDEGWSLRRIAVVAKMTPQGVKLICDATSGQGVGL